MNTKEFFEKVAKETLVAIFYKETQMGRSITKNIKKFKEELMIEIKQLLKKVDSNKLKNLDIRKAITRLDKLPCISAGQAQKVINVYLKYYCLLLRKKRVIKELDSPLDSQIMKEYKDKSKQLKKIPLKYMDFKTYKKWQEHLNDKGGGIKLDIKTYDTNRIKEFLK